MAKRRADKQLNDRNWDDEDPVEEPGVFERASDDVIAKRMIRRAKRTLPQSDDAAPRPNPFAGFSFNQNGGSASTLPTVTVNSNGTSGSTRTSNEYLLKVAQLNRDIHKFIDRIMMDSDPYLNLTPCFDDYIKHFQRLTTEEEERQRKNNNNNNNNNSITSTASSMTSSALTTGGFRTSTSTGITSSKVAAADTEPKATFTFGTKAATTTTSPKASADFNAKTSGSSFTFGAPAASTAGNSLRSSSGGDDGGGVKDATSPVKFTFGAPPSTSHAALSSPEAPVKSVFGSSRSVFGGAATSTSNTEAPATFKFGSPASAGAEDKVEQTGSPSQPLFSFNAKTGFKFGSAPASANSASPAVTAAAPEANDDDDDVPPKVDVTPVEEEGSLYMKKVKLFYKKSESDDKGQYADKGVGFLHIKKLDGGGYQLLVRAQSTLGNVLLNIRLGKDMPVKSVGRNNVAIICVPNPRLDPKARDDKPDPPTMFLIRVKTSEDATELREKLIEFKDSV